MRSTGLVDRRATSPRPPASSASRRKGSGWISGTWLTFAVLAYAALLHYSTQVVFAPLFAYLRYREPDSVGYGVSLAVGVVSSLLLPRRLVRGSHVVLWIVQVAAALPAMWCAQYLDILSVRESLVFAVHVGGSLLVARGVAMALPTVRASFTNRQRRTGYWWALVGLAGAVYAVLFLVAGARPQFDGILDVYDVRSSFEVTAGGLPLVGYLMPVAANVINPMLFVRGIVGRRPVLLAVGLGGQVALFLVAGQKSVLFSTVFLFGLVLLYRGGRVPSATTLVGVVCSMSVVAYLVDALTGTISASSVLVRRFLILPGAIAAAYVQIFTEHPQTHFADSILRFLDNPYSEGPAPTYIVGLLYMGDPRTSANVSPFGHGYLSEGYLGIYIEALVLGLLLWAIDQASDGLSAQVQALMVVMPAIVVASASIFTALLTHGLLALVVALALCPRDGWEGRSWLGRPRRSGTRRTAQLRGGMSISTQRSDTLAAGTAVHLGCGGSDVE